MYQLENTVMFVLMNSFMFTMDDDMLQDDLDVFLNKSFGVLFTSMMTFTVIKLLSSTIFSQMLMCSFLCVLFALVACNCECLCV